MHDAERYRHNAAECQLAAHAARQPHHSKLNFSIGALWLALARQDEVINDLLASWGSAESTKNNDLVLSPPTPPALLPQRHQFPIAA
jgi:hypothetical protein